MTERPAAGERAVIVQLDFGQPDLEDQLEEVALKRERAGERLVRLAHLTHVPRLDRPAQAGPRRRTPTAFFAANEASALKPASKPGAMPCSGASVAM